MTELEDLDQMAMLVLQSVSSLSTSAAARRTLKLAFQDSVIKWINGFGDKKSDA